ncbi:MAG: hypothetical protein HC836_37265 [Richelia sp. RM2_1_2]|nr:hypothetical protein [Richelia sp. RM2_1_2]
MTIYHVIGFIIGVITAQIILYYMKNKPKEKEEGYNGESEDFFQFNKKIVIRREDGSPYLYRRTLIGIGQWFSIKLHQILISDDACMHCHPWSFLTFILKGGYYEWTPIEQKEGGKILEKRIGVDGNEEVKRWHGAGRIMYRPAHWKHKLELKINEPLFRVRENNGNMFINETPSKTIRAHTLVFTFKVCREWGFYTKNGWIFWKNYESKRDC